MKTLKRKTLDELRAEMPVLSETEQRRCKGGTFYCDLSGNNLGQVGSGDDLKFCSASDFQTYNAGNIEGQGISFGSLNNAGQYNFILSHSSFSNAQIGKYPPGTVAAGQNADGVLAINENSFVWNNYHDALSTLEHEQYHNAGKDYLTTGNELTSREVSAYERQISSGTFQSTSDAYKRATADSLYEYYQKQGKSITKDEVYRQVGLPGY